MLTRVSHAHTKQTKHAKKAPTHLRLRDEELAVVVQEAIEPLQHLGRGQVQLV